MSRAATRPGDRPASHADGRPGADPPHPVYTSDHPAIGTYEQALTHLGRTSPRYRAELPVSEGSVKMFCAMIHDANPVYWDRQLARDVFGGPVAPPALVQATVLPLPWKPAAEPPQALAVFAVPLPGRTLINVSTDAINHRPFFVGEAVSYYDEVVDVSPERATRLGTGHFITTVFHYEGDGGGPIADVTNVMFRFGETTTGAAASAATAAQTSPAPAQPTVVEAGHDIPTAQPGGEDAWQRLAAGAVLPETALDVTEQTVILVPVSTWDLFPGHYSPGYAHAQGQQDMYLNTIALQGVVDRSATDHLGPEAWISRRKLAMIGSVYPGDRLEGAASVLAVRCDGSSPSADLVVQMSTTRGPALRAELTVQRYAGPTVEPVTPATPTEGTPN